jgi:hypothetical protein
VIPSEPEQNSVHASITDEMVEAAAGALWDHREREERRWHSYVDPGDLRDLRAEARAALEAALDGAA